MANHGEAAFRNIVWQMNIPGTMLDLYFNHVRILPSWKLNFPEYVHPAIRDVVELASNQTKITTRTGEYVFVFDERSTFVLEAAEFVKTGILEILYNAELVLRLTISPSDPDGLGTRWVARGVEEFKDGECVAELAELDLQLAAHEAQQTKEEEARRQDELKGVAELKQKLSKLPPVEVKEASWFRRLLGHSGI
jgi:hypothetical protein